MRIRTIKPELPQSESIGRVSREARLLFILLWPICDDSGRTRAASRMLASLLFPYDEDAPALIDGWMAELERENMVRRYRIEGDTYLEICNWLKHQKIDKPSRSKIPPFDESSRILANPRERSSGDRDQGPRTKDQGSIPPAVAAGAGEDLKLEGEEQKPQATTPPHALPPEPPKAKKPRERDPLFDALAVACGNSPHELTKTAARECAVALAEIRSVSPGLTSAEIHLRSANYRSHFPDAACTAFALAKHWARCGEQFRQTPQQLRPAVC